MDCLTIFLVKEVSSRIGIGDVYIYIQRPVSQAAELSQLKAHAYRQSCITLQLTQVVLTYHHCINSKSSWPIPSSKSLLYQMRRGCPMTRVATRRASMNTNSRMKISQISGEESMRSPDMKEDIDLIRTILGLHRKKANWCERYVYPPTTTGYVCLTV